jgi:hypothetical protein
MDMDSPFSPNDSDISDIFEPPSIFDKLTPGNKKGRKANGNVSSSTRMHSKIGKRGRKGKLKLFKDLLLFVLKSKQKLEFREDFNNPFKFIQIKFVTKNFSLLLFHENGLQSCAK